MELKINDVAFGGNGVGRLDGKAVFVPYTIPGELVEAHITRDRGKFAEAELEGVLEVSPDRVDPPCRFFMQCGGCAYQHIAYPAQLRIKQKQVQDTLRRVGGFAELEIAPVVGSPLPLGYRNRIRVHIDGGMVGFFSRERQSLVEIDRCELAMPAVNDELMRFRRKRGIRAGEKTIALRRTGSFEQTNDGVAKLLLAHVAAQLDKGGKLLVDAYCGSGFFAKPVRDKFERVVGIELNDRAVARASADALPHETYLTGSVDAHLDAVLAADVAAETSVVLDPPSSGLSQPVVDILARRKPARLIYVSCDPATMARDLKKLAAAGYNIRNVTPFDMFPQTAEIEVVAELVS